MLKTSLSFLSGRFLFIFSGLGFWSILFCATTFAETSPLIIAELPPPSMTQMNDDSSSYEGEYGTSSVPQSINAIPSFESTPENPESPEQEYNFQAPQPDNYSPSTPVDKSVEFYRVEVMVKEVSSEEESLLSQVKEIEPFAYLQSKEGVIYAGLFQDQQEAQQRVQQLTNRGFSARIVPVSYNVSSSYNIPVQQ